MVDACEEEVGVVEREAGDVACGVGIGFFNGGQDSFCFCHVCACLASKSSVEVF